MCVLVSRVCPYQPRRTLPNSSLTVCVLLPWARSNGLHIDQHTLQASVLGRYVSLSLILLSPPPIANANFGAFCSAFFSRSSSTDLESKPSYVDHLQAAFFSRSSSTDVESRPSDVEHMKTSYFRHATSMRYFDKMPRRIPPSSSPFSTFATTAATVSTPLQSVPNAEPLERASDFKTSTVTQPLPDAALAPTC